MPKRRFTKEKTDRLAQARIEILWKHALQEAKIHPEIAKRQMLSARKIAQRARTKLPRDINRRICKECGTILIPGDTCRVRIRHARSKHMVVTCTRCGNIRRYSSSLAGPQA